MDGLEQLYTQLSQDKRFAQAYPDSQSFINTFNSSNELQKRKIYNDWILDEENTPTVDTFLSFDKKKSIAGSGSGSISPLPTSSFPYPDLFSKLSPKFNGSVPLPSISGGGTMAKSQADIENYLKDPKNQEAFYSFAASQYSLGPDLDSFKKSLTVQPVKGKSLAEKPKDLGLGYEKPAVKFQNKVVQSDMPQMINEAQGIVEPPPDNNTEDILKTGITKQTKVWRQQNDFLKPGMVWEGTDGSVIQNPTPEDLGKLLLEGGLVSLSDGVNISRLGGESAPIGWASDTQQLDEGNFKTWLQDRGMTEDQANSEIQYYKDLYLKKQVDTRIKDKLKEFSQGKKATDVHQSYLDMMDNKSFDLLMEREEFGFNEREAIGKMVNYSDRLEQGQKLSEKEMNDYWTALETMKSKLNDYSTLYDPETGKYYSRGSAPESAKVYRQTLNQELVKYRDTDRGQLKKIRDELIFKTEVLKEERDKAFQQYQDALAGSQTDKTDRTKEAYKYINQQFANSQAQRDAANLAYFANVDPTQALDAGGLGDKLNTFKNGFYSSLPFSGEYTTNDYNSSRKKAQAFVSALKEGGGYVSEAQRQASENTIGDDIVYSMGAMVPIMAEIALTGNIVPEVAALKESRYGQQVASTFNNLFGTKAGKVASDLLFEGVRGYSVYAPTSETGATGVGESLFSQGLYDKLGLDVMSKSWSPMLKYLSRVAFGTAGETAEEFAGQYTNALSDSGFDWEASVDKAFGKDLDEFTRQLLVIGITSSMMSAAFNLGSLRKLEEVKTQLEERASDPKTSEENKQAFNGAVENINRTVEEVTKRERTEDDKENQTGVSSPIQQGQEPIQTQPVQEPSREETQGRGNVQAPQEKINEEAAPQTQEAGVLNTPSGMNPVETTQTTPDRVDFLFHGDGKPVTDEYGWTSTHRYASRINEQENSDLEKAKALDEQGVEKIKILRDTGWFKFGDGTWRKEIDDSKFVLKKPIPGNYKLGDILDAPELYRLHPEAENIVVVIDPNVIGGSYQPGTPGIIEIQDPAGLHKSSGEYDIPADVAFRGVLLHEIQHHIQESDNLARGGNTDTLMDNYSSQYTSLKESLNDTEESLRIAKEFMPNDTRYINEIQKGVDIARAKMDEFDRQYPDGVTSEQSKAAYRILAGEVEANNVIRRMSMDAKLRSLVHPDITEKLITRGEDKIYYTTSTDMRAMKFEPETKASAESEQVRTFLNKLEAKFPGSKVHVFNSVNQTVGDKTILQIIRENSEEDNVRTARGILYGFRLNNEIYISEQTMNSEVAIHEFGHLWLDVIENDHPEVFTHGIELLKEEGQEFIDEIKNNPRYKGLSEERILKEALVTAIGRIGSQITNITPTKYQKLIEWVKALFAKIIGKETGVDGLTSSTSFKDFVERAVGEITQTGADVNENETGLDMMTGSFSPKWTTNTQEILDADTAIRHNTPGISDTEAARQIVEKNLFPIPQLVQVLGSRFSENYTQAVLEDGKRVLEEQRGRILERRKEIVEILNDATLALDDALVKLKNDGYQDFEVANGLIAAGHTSDTIAGIYGENYHKTIESMIESESLAPEVIESLEQDARNLRFGQSLSDMLDSVEDLPIDDAALLVRYMEQNMALGGFEGAFAKITELLKAQISGKDVNQEFLTLTADVSSIAGRILWMMRGLSTNHNGMMEQAIIKGIEENGQPISQEVRAQIAEYVKQVTTAKKDYDAKKKAAADAAENGTYSDQVEADLTAAELVHVSAIAQLNRYTSKFFDPLMVERVMAATAKSLLSLRSTTVGAWSNLWNWIYAQSKPARAIRIAADSLLGRWFPGMARVTYNVLPQVSRTDIVKTVNKQRATLNPDGTITITVGDTKNFKLGGVVLDENIRQAQIIKMTKDTMVLAPLGDINPATGNPPPFNIDIDFRSGGEVTRVISNPDMNVLQVWARKHARRRSFRQIKTTLLYGFQSNQGVVKGYGDAFANFDVFAEASKAPKMIVGLFENKFGLHMTDEEFAQKFERIGIQIEENGVKNFVLPGGKTGQVIAQMISSVSAAGGIPSEVVIRAISLSGDRLAFNSVMQRALIDLALYRGITDPDRIRLFVLNNWTKEFDSDFAPTKLSERQIFAGRNWLSKKLIGTRTKLLSKSKMLRAQHRTGETGAHTGRRALLDASAYGLFIISPFTVIPSNVIARAITLSNPFIALGVSGTRLYSFRKKYLAYLEKYPDSKEALTAAEKRQKLKDEDDLFYLRRRLLDSFVDMTVSLVLGSFVTSIIMSGAATPPAGEDRERDRLGQLSGKEPGTFNLTHYINWMSGKRKVLDKWEQGDVVFRYPNAGSFGFILSTRYGEESIYRTFEKDKQHNAIEILDPSYLAMAIGSFGQAIDQISLMQSFANITGVMGAIKKGDDNALEKMTANILKTMLSPMAPNAFSFLERAQGLRIDDTKNFYPAIEDKEYLPKMLLRVWTSLSGRMLMDWQKSPLYRTQIGAFGEDLKNRTGFGDENSFAAYAGAMFDPFNTGRYQGGKMTKEEEENARLYSIIQMSSQILADELDEKSPVYRFVTGDTKNKWLVANEDGDLYTIPIPDDIYRGYLKELGFQRKQLVTTAVNSMEQVLIRMNGDEENLQENEDQIRNSLREYFDIFNNALGEAESFARNKVEAKLFDYYYKNRDKISEETLQQLGSRIGRDLKK